MNWSVLPRFLSMWSSTVGTRDSSRLQVVSSPDAAGSGRAAVAVRRVALRRYVGELAARPDHPAVRALEDLGRIARVDRDLVLVGWIPFGAFSHPLSKYGANAHQFGWLTVASYDRSVNVRMVAAPSPSRPDRLRSSSRGPRGRSSGRCRSRRRSCCTAARRTGSTRSRTRCPACRRACRRPGRTSTAACRTPCSRSTDSPSSSTSGTASRCTSAGTCASPVGRRARRRACEREQRCRRLVAAVGPPEVRGERLADEAVAGCVPSVR